MLVLAIEVKIACMHTIFDTVQKVWKYHQKIFLLICQKWPNLDMPQPRL